MTISRKKRGVVMGTAGGEWLHEIKFDGYRVAARLEDRRVRMLTRNALDWTARFGPIAVAATKLKARTAYIDGGNRVLDDAGISDFGGLQEALSEGQTERMVYIVFDLLHLDGRDLRGLPLTERKAHLEKLIGRAGDGGAIRYSDHVIGRGPDFYKQACKSNLEGIVSERAGAPYRSGRSADWLKTKCTRRQEVVIGGWRRSSVETERISRQIYSELVIVARGMMGIRRFRGPDTRIPSPQLPSSDAAATQLKERAPEHWPWRFPTRRSREDNSRDSPRASHRIDDFPLASIQRLRFGRPWERLPYSPGSGRRPRPRSKQFRAKARKKFGA